MTADFLAFSPQGGKQEKPAEFMTRDLTFLKFFVFIGFTELKKRKLYLVFGIVY